MDKVRQPVGMSARLFVVSWACRPAFPVLVRGCCTICAEPMHKWSNGHARVVHGPRTAARCPFPFPRWGLEKVCLL
ncbi:hypothetical protein [Segatella buccae]